MTLTFSNAVRAAIHFETLRQRAIFAAIAAGGVLVAAGVSANSFPIGFAGVMLAIGALARAKP
jgi:hypothetical protein